MSGEEALPHVGDAGSGEYSPPLSVKEKATTDLSASCHTNQQRREPLQSRPPITIGKFAQAIVRRKIKDNRFVIKTDKPRVEVSWQVTGVRQDAYAEANRIRVEEEKTGQERGTYLHPEAFGQPRDQTQEIKRQPAHQ